MPDPTRTRDSEVVLNARAAAHESWAKTVDRPARTAAARRAKDAQFLEQADGDPVRAASLRKAYYTRLALKSVQARRKARELTEDAVEAEAELAQMGDEDRAALAQLVTRGGTVGHGVTP